MTTATSTAVLLATALQLPVAGRAATRLAGEPTVETTLVGGVPCLIARPARTGVATALVFANAVHPDGAGEPDARRGLRGLAQAGFLVVAPDLPGLRSGEITPATLETLVAVAADVADRPDARDGRVTLLGACTGAGLSLLAAQDPRIAGRVRSVFGLAPFADLRNVLRLSTTGHYVDGADVHPYPVAPLLARAASRSLALTLEPSASRQALLDAWRADAPDSEIGVIHAEMLTPDAAAVAMLLQNRDPGRFDALFAALPAHARRTVDRLSPIRRIDGIEAHVELATGPSDRYFPLSEARALERSSPRVRLTVTSTLEHTRPRLGAGDLTDLVRFAGFAGRLIRSA